MMSDEENDDDDDDEVKIDSRDTIKESVTPSYPFSSLRQGWPKHLKNKLEHARSVQRQALHDDSDSNNNNADDDDDDDDLNEEKRFNKHRRMGAGWRKR
jgi:hypothetical protein